MIITSQRPNKVAWPPQTTKDAYANLGDPWDKEHLKTCTLVVANTGSTNATKIQVLGSVNGGQSFDVSVQAEKEVAAGKSETIYLDVYVTNIVVQIKASVAGSQTTVAAYAAGIPV